MVTQSTTCSINRRPHHITRLFTQPSGGAVSEAQAKIRAIRSTARWARMSAAVLRRDPVCCNPLHLHDDVVTPTTEAHHIVGLAKDLSLAFVFSNCVGLCVSCHREIERLELNGQDTIPSVRQAIELLKRDGIKAGTIVDKPAGINPTQQSSSNPSPLVDSKTKLLKTDRNSASDCPLWRAEADRGWVAAQLPSCCKTGAAIVLSARAPVAPPPEATPTPPPSFQVKTCRVHGPNKVYCVRMRKFKYTVCPGCNHIK